MSNLHNLHEGGHRNDVIVTSRDTNQTQKQTKNEGKGYILLRRKPVVNRVKISSSFQIVVRNGLHISELTLRHFVGMFLKVADLEEFKFKGTQYNIA